MAGELQPTEAMLSSTPFGRKLRVAAETEQGAKA